MSLISRARPAQPSVRACRRAMTLVEMLIAMALTLILVYAIAELYARIGPSVKDGRAMIDLVAQLRTASSRLRADLEMLTVTMGVSGDDGKADGYFEIGEGGNDRTNGGRFVCSDADANRNNLIDTRNPPLTGAEDGNANGINDFAENNVTNMYGDTDDILAFTIRSDGAPFTGKACVPGSNPPLYFNISSNLAEVIWFTSFTDMNANGVRDIGEPQFLHRRLLLVVPGVAAGLPDNGATNVEYFKYNDVSAHLTAGGYVPNRFDELSRRENRFAHRGRPNFPNELLLNPFESSWLTTYTLQGENLGEDRVLANVLSFDVRVYDPQAVIRPDADPIANAVGTLQPGDPGYLEVIRNAYSSSGNTYRPSGFGAYVDVGYGHGLHAQLVAQGETPANATLILSNTLGSSQFAFQPPTYLALFGRTYDTWAQSYERDGDNQDNDSFAGQPLIDEGTDGFDNDGLNGVDDPGERETTPPYPHPLRGIQIGLRVYEPTTRQVRQATIGWDFVSE
ncbi:MAG: prepilin-type N-terminal cleavage/methylation domain-containing protein [Planctomycetaceae bacterium]|nr:prepilin-type N-terminal cleavage/methylation domain-containing protein [Planctomycetaceae bacterium]